MLNFYTKHFKLLTLCLLTFISLSTNAASKAPQTLTIALLVFSAEQRQAFEEVAHQFERQYPNTNIHFIIANDSSYKKNMQRWLEEPSDVDILHWAWTAQLRENAHKGLVYPLTKLWHSLNLSSSIKGYISPLITVNEQVYGLPYSSAIWGVYYRKSLFQQFNLAPPTNWSQLVTLCQTLSKQNIPAFALGTAQHWPVAAWFDYINLRLNGLNYHQDVMAGKESFSSRKMRRVFEHWKQLIDNKCFIDKPHYFNEKNVLPLLYRNQAAMLLSGSFTMSQISAEIRDDFDMFSFPIISADVEVIEQMPTDMLIIPEASKHKPLAEKFLRYLAQSRLLDWFNHRINFISPLGQVFPEQSPLLKRSIAIMNKADNFLQFYDRETIIPFTKPTVEVMSSFVETGNIDATLLALEKIRLHIFRQKKGG